MEQALEEEDKAGQRAKKEEHAQKQRLKAAVDKVRVKEERAEKAARLQQKREHKKQQQARRALSSSMKAQEAWVLAKVQERDNAMDEVGLSMEDMLSGDDVRGVEDVRVVEDVGVVEDIRGVDDDVVDEVVTTVENPWSGEGLTTAPLEKQLGVEEGIAALKKPWKNVEDESKKETAEKKEETIDRYCMEEDEERKEGKSVDEEKEPKDIYNVFTPLSTPQSTPLYTPESTPSSTPLSSPFTLPSQATSCTLPTFNSSRILTPTSPPIAYFHQQLYLLLTPVINTFLSSTRTTHPSVQT